MPDQEQVFISYSSTDEDAARAIVTELERIQIEYFLDKKDIRWGDDITNEISRALRECTCVLVILTHSSLQSHWVPFEVGQAVALGKKILPYLTDPAVDVPLYLRQYHFKNSVSEVRDYFLRGHRPIDGSIRLFGCLRTRVQVERIAASLRARGYNAVIHDGNRSGDMFHRDKADYEENKRYYVPNKVEFHPRRVKRSAVDEMVASLLKEIGVQFDEVYANDLLPSDRVVSIYYERGT